MFKSFYDKVKIDQDNTIAYQMKEIEKLEAENERLEKQNAILLEAIDLALCEYSSTQKSHLIRAEVMERCLSEALEKIKELK